MKQTQIKHSKTIVNEEEDIVVATARREAMDTSIDDILDEIDGVLEKDAEQFVQDYVQKGGQ
jgi:ubiquitin-like protein Pup